MKHRHIALVWFLADIILAIATLLYPFFDSLGSSDKAIETTFLICWYGLLLSLPSLLSLLILNSFLMKQSAKSRDAYVYAILGINFLYFIATALFFGFHDAGIYFLFFAGTTLAGLLSLYLIKKFILNKTPINLNDLF